MSKILTIKEAETVSSQLHAENKAIVLAGGSFDLLHIGHVKFLTQAKNKGDVLMLLLEHDESVTKRKGSARPIYTQQDRAEMLAALSSVDYIVKLSPRMKDNDYDRLAITIKPAIIATTKDDPARSHKERQAGIINAAVLDVIERVPQQSTSKLAEIVAKEFSL